MVVLVVGQREYMDVYTLWYGGIYIRYDCTNREQKSHVFWHFTMNLGEDFFYSIVESIKSATLYAFGTCSRRIKPKYSLQWGKRGKRRGGE